MSESSYHPAAFALQALINQSNAVERELARLEAFLGLPLARIPVKTDPIGRHAQHPEIQFPDFLNAALAEHGYQ
jgi:hypothetical protein